MRTDEKGGILITWRRCTTTRRIHKQASQEYKAAPKKFRFPEYRQRLYYKMEFITFCDCGSHFYYDTNAPIHLHTDPNCYKKFNFNLFLYINVYVIVFFQVYCLTSRRIYCSFRQRPLVNRNSFDRRLRQARIDCIEVPDGDIIYPALR